MHEIVLDRPGKNAMGTALMSFVRAELKAAAGQPVLLRGTGDALSAGLDLKEVASLDAAGMKTFLDLLEELVLELYTYPAPTVVFVNGHAIAGGCVLTLCCDQRVMQRSDKARVGLNEVALGLRFPPRVLLMAQDRVPRRHHERVLLGAELHGAEKALELGLIDELSDDGLAAAQARLALLARHPADAYAATKARLRHGVLDVDAEERARYERDDLPLWTSDALKSRVRALLAR